MQSETADIDEEEPTFDVQESSGASGQSSDDSDEPGQSDGASNSEFGENGGKSNNDSETESILELDIPVSTANSITTEIVGLRDSSNVEEIETRPIVRE